MQLREPQVDEAPIFRLAARLGVEPLDQDQNPFLQFRATDGRRLDLVAVINALLDRLDQAAP